MNKLSNLSGYSSGELECTIDRELSALGICLYYPHLGNIISGPTCLFEPPLPTAIELPPRRSYGRVDSLENHIWLFRFDTSYTIICTAPVPQRKLDALAVLSDDDIVVSSPQKDGAEPLMLKFSNRDNLTLAVTVLRQTLYALQAASDTGKVWHL